MTSITDGTVTLHPILWTQYRSTREARTRTHPLASGGTAVSLARSGPRRVNVALLFDDELESEQCEAMHARPGVITITETDRPTHSMQYVVVGNIERELDPETADVWIVTAEVLEVGAS